MEWNWRKEVVAKNLEYYLNLNFEVIIRTVTKYDKIFYEATIKELDKLTFYGVGKTPQKAINELKSVKEEMFKYYFDNGIEIPEPGINLSELPSGKFVLRLSPFTHLKLINESKNNNQSLNSYVNLIIENYLARSHFINELNECLSDRLPCKRVWERDYKMSNVEPLFQKSDPAYNIALKG